MAFMNSNKTFLPPLWILTLAGVILFIWLLVSLKEIVTLLVVSYCIAYVMNPALCNLEARRIPRAAGFVLILLLMALAASLLGIIALPTLAREYRALANNFPEYFELARQRADFLFSYAVDYLPENLVDEDGAFSLMAALPEVNEEMLRRAGRALVATLLSGYSVTLAIINMLLLPFLLFYIAVDFQKINFWFLSFFSVLKRPKVLEIAREIDVQVSGFIKAQVLVGFILFVLYAFGLWLIGVELWFLLALITGFGNIIPYLGFTVGIVLTSVMTLVTFGTFSPLLSVWAYFAVVQTVESIYLTPKIQGDKVGLSPLVVILAIVAGGKLFGLLGIFLAVPATAIIRVLGKKTHKWLIHVG